MQGEQQSDASTWMLKDRSKEMKVDIAEIVHSMPFGPRRETGAPFLLPRAAVSHARAHGRLNRQPVLPGDGEFRCSSADRCVSEGLEAPTSNAADPGVSKLVSLACWLLETWSSMSMQDVPSASPRSEVHQSSAIKICTPHGVPGEPRRDPFPQDTVQQEVMLLSLVNCFSFLRQFSKSRQIWLTVPSALSRTDT
jgi:hypothetical protein